MLNKERQAETKVDSEQMPIAGSSAQMPQNPMLGEDLPPDCVDILCYFKDSDGFIICRVGHWNTLLKRFRIHSDGLDRYYKEIIEWQEIPLMITVL